MQLLGEEYNSREQDYKRDMDSEISSRSDSPLRADNPNYDDSLDVAFEYNNKLRDKIQQKMRESENLISSSLGHKRTEDLDCIFGSNYDHEGKNIKNKAHAPFGGMMDRTISSFLNPNNKHDHE